MATPRLGLVVEDKPTELSCTRITGRCSYKHKVDPLTAVLECGCRNHCMSVTPQD